MPVRIEDHLSLARCAAGGAALCTIVRIEGSFSRRLGAQIAIGEGGDFVGSLADGCIEAQLCREVERVHKQGNAAVVRFGQGSKSIDHRLPCGSGIDVLVDCFPDARQCAKVIAQLDNRAEGELALAYVGNEFHLQTRRYIPSPRVIILGSGPEVNSLARQAAGFRLDVEVHLPFENGQGLSLGRAPSGIACDPWTAVVVLFHDHEWERALLRWALDTPAFYIGAQGGKVIRERRNAELLADGARPTEIRRIHSPIGVIPRTRDPEMLALSVLAEIMAEYDALHPHN